MTRYRIEHRTLFEYAGPVRESVMELRMRPREGGGQTCSRFELSIAPQAAAGDYVDPYGNLVHYFTLPRPHESLAITAAADVDLLAAPFVAAAKAAADTGWDALRALGGDRSHFAWLADSPFARTSPVLEAFATEIAPDAALAPCGWLTALRDRLRDALRYAPNSTRADSPIEHCLGQRAGVCQDFAHVFIALARRQGIPCRYVSGYLFHRENQADRSGEDATHAWAEAFLPGAGWIGFDAANGIAVADRHVRVAVGRDYSDVPPTRGVYRGPPTRRHQVQVIVARDGAPPESTQEPIVMSGFECEVQQQSPNVVARLAGTLGAAEVETLEKALQPTLGGKPRRVILELSGLAMMGSAGVGALLKLKRVVEGGGGRLVLAAVPEPIRRILVFSQLNRVFTMASDVEDAARGD